MAEWEGKSRGNVLGYRIFAWLLQKGGRKPAYILLRFIAFYFIPFAPKATRSSYFYFRHILGFSRLKSAFSVYRNYCSLGEALIDRTATLAGLPVNLTFEFDGEHHLHRMVEEGKGGLLLSAHIGNWEIAGHFLHQFSSDIHIVMYDEERQKIKEFLDTIQVEKNPGQNVFIIPIKDDLSHIVLIRQAIERGDLLIMLGDRFPEGSKTFEFEFMGKKATLPSGPFYLATKFKIPVSFCFACKEGSSHYHLFATPPKVYALSGSPEERNRQLRVMIQDYLNEMEDKIKRYPYQWYNFYPYWHE
jgi:predicted LPLAT superfamily acyltransferase